MGDDEAVLFLLAVDTGLRRVSRALFDVLFAVNIDSDVDKMDLDWFVKTLNGHEAAGTADWASLRELRNVMHVLFECAVRWELVRDNPVTRVRQGGSPHTEPDVLTPVEFRELLGELNQQPYRTMVVLAGCLGLSCSELVGLKWADIDWGAATLSVKRGVVHCHVGNPKTLARRKPIPLAPELLTVLREHRERMAYAADSDWVFASPYKLGAELYWPDSALQDFVKPAAGGAGITKRVGWHTFRHSYSTLLRANGTDVKVQSELLRHSNIVTSLNVYTQAANARNSLTMESQTRAIRRCRSPQ